MLTTLAVIAGLSMQQPQSCDCTAAFDSVVSEVQRNYAGFQDKVSDRTRTEYDQLKARLRGQAGSAQTVPDCHRVLIDLVAFFKDGHIGVSNSGTISEPPPEEIRARYRDWRRINLSEDGARTLVGHSKAHPLAGIWRSTAAPEYRLAIVQHPSVQDTVVAVVLKADSIYWMPGQVKALFTPTDSGGYATRFYMRDHSEREFTARLHDNLLRFSNGSAWLRLEPKGPVSLEQYVASLNTEFRISDVDSQTVLVQIPSFDNRFAKTIDSLFAANETKLRSTRNLIVDLRGNGGGSDYNYRHLLPLIYTKPIKTVSVAMYATPDNTRRMQAVADDPEFPAGARAGLQARIDRMRKQPGEFVPEEDAVSRRDTVLANPQRVAVIIDRGCGSTCEQFILAARQSDKVILYGDNTAGVLDYANLLSAPLPCTGLVLRYATSRSKRLPNDPVDPMGIAPNVRIPGNELFPVEWVRRAMQTQRAVGSEF